VTAGPRLGRAVVVAVAALGLAAGTGACGSVPIRVAALDDMERVRGSAGANEAAKLAPEAYAHADQERAYAREAHAASDDVGAKLHAERAIAAYGHAFAIARYALATAELVDAQKALDDATTQEAALEASRLRLEQDAEALAEQVRIARDRLLPAPSAAATPEREAARVVAARSIGMQARLLCAAARLVTPDARGLADAEGEVAALDVPPPTLGRLDARAAAAPAAPPVATGQDRAHDEHPSPRPAPIDAAARARARCLDVLTRARRAAGYDAGVPDALLAELSAAGGWDPSSDERGVVVTLRDAFHGAELTEAGAARLADLGRVAASHPLFGVQVVVHDARPHAAGETTDARRADAAVQSLVHAGANPSRVHAELAGALAPVVDPGDAAARGRNERLEVVFVGRGATL
jgi:hypothetical protein